MQLGSSHNMYESREGSQVYLEFADPNSSPIVECPPDRPRAMHRASSPLARSIPLSPFGKPRSAPALSRAISWSGVLRRDYNSTGTPALSPSVSSGSTTVSGGQTRLQATFQAIKKMSVGLASPRIDYGWNKPVVQSPGYFDVTTEEGGDS